MILTSGTGWDLHRLEEGGKLMIGGVQIEHTKGTIAHSDGMLLLVCDIFC